MRISRVAGDPGFTVYFAQYTVTLDGFPLSNVMTADEELGQVRCVKIDSNGHIVWVHGQVLREVRFGVVEITGGPGAPDSPA